MVARMWNHWSYKEDSPSNRLEQGDVLRLDPALIRLIAEYHPYYAKHPDNRFYLVLTQTCDLVPRNNTCKARYIALAPVRPLKSIVKREYDEKLSRTKAGVAYSSEQLRGVIGKFLERLFNNNESTYFFLQTESAAGLYEDMCAVLSLPISFKAEHYHTFLQSRIIGIQDTFQAKLGSLLGQMYSRVGTPDFEPRAMTAKVKETTDNMALWFTERDHKELRKLVEHHQSKNPDTPVDENVLVSLKEQIPKQKSIAIDRIIEVATSAGIGKEDYRALDQLRSKLQNDSIIASLFNK